MLPKRENHDDELANDGHTAEGDGVGQRAKILPEGELGHDLGGGFAHKLGDGDDGVSVGA